MATDTVSFDMKIDIEEKYRLTTCVCLGKKVTLTHIRCAGTQTQRKGLTSCYITTAAVEGATSAKMQFHYPLYQSERHTQRFNKAEWS